jgi:hypothetical protein
MTTTKATPDALTLIKEIKALKDQRHALDERIVEKQRALTSCIFFHDGIKYAVTEDGIFVELIPDTPWHKSGYSKILNIHSLDAFTLDNVIAFLQAYTNHLHEKTA